MFCNLLRGIPIYVDTAQPMATMVAWCWEREVITRISQGRCL